jgi:hypothetical protein
MKIAIGSDEQTHLTDFVCRELELIGHTLVKFGALRENASHEEKRWTNVARDVAESVSYWRVRTRDFVLLDRHGRNDCGKQSSEHSRRALHRCRNRKRRAPMEQRQHFSHESSPDFRNRCQRNAPRMVRNDARHRRRKPSVPCLT